MRDQLVNAWQTAKFNTPQAQNTRSKNKQKLFVLMVASKIGNKYFRVISEWLFTAMFGGTKYSLMRDKVNIFTLLSSVSGMVLLRSPISLDCS